MEHGASNQRDIRLGEDFRILDDRRDDERRGDVPDSVKPFLGWVVPAERRERERRTTHRRKTD